MTINKRIIPHVRNIVVTDGSTKDYPINQVDFGGVATFVQIQNFSGSLDCELYLDDCEDPVIVPANGTQIFNHGDLHLTHIAFGNGPSGGSDVSVQVVWGVSL